MTKQKENSQNLIESIHLDLYRIIFMLRQTRLSGTLKFAEDTYILFESELRHLLEKQRISRKC